MYVDFVHRFLFSVYGCFSSGLLHHYDTGKPSINAVLDGLNDRDPVFEQKITTGDLQTLILAFQKEYTSRVNKNKIVFDLQKKSSLPRKTYKLYKNGESIIRRQTWPDNIQHAHHASDALNSPEGYPVKIKELKKEHWSPEMSGRPKRGKQGSQRYTI